MGIYQFQQFYGGYDSNSAISGGVYLPISATLEGVVHQFQNVERGYIIEHKRLKRGTSCVVYECNRPMRGLHFRASTIHRPSYTTNPCALTQQNLKNLVPTTHNSSIQILLYVLES